MARSVDRTADSVHLFLNLPASVTDAEIRQMAEQGQGLADPWDRDLFKLGFFGVPSGNNVATIATYEMTGTSNVQRLTGVPVPDGRGRGLGDLNLDGALSPGDLENAAGAFEDVLWSRDTQFSPAADTNADGRVTCHDLVELGDVLTDGGADPATLLAWRAVKLRRVDFDADGLLTDSDVAVLEGQFGTAEWTHDLTADGQVDQADKDFLLAHFTIEPDIVPPAAEPVGGQSTVSIEVRWGPNGNPSGRLYRVECWRGAGFEGVGSKVAETDYVVDLGARTFGGLWPDTFYSFRARAKAAAPSCAASSAGPSTPTTAEASTPTIATSRETRPSTRRSPRRLGSGRGLDGELLVAGDPPADAVRRAGDADEEEAAGHGAELADAAGLEVEGEADGLDGDREALGLAGLGGLGEGGRDEGEDLLLVVGHLDEAEQVGPRLAAALAGEGLELGGVVVGDDGLALHLAEVEHVDAEVAEREGVVGRDAVDVAALEVGLEGALPLGRRPHPDDDPCPNRKDDDENDVADAQPPDGAWQRHLADLALALVLLGLRGLDGAAEGLALGLGDGVLALGGDLRRGLGCLRRGGVALRAEQGIELGGAQEALLDEDLAETALVAAAEFAEGHLILEAGIEVIPRQQPPGDREVADAEARGRLALGLGRGRLRGLSLEALPAGAARDAAADELVGHRVLLPARATDLRHVGPLRFGRGRRSSGAERHRQGIGIRPAAAGAQAVRIRPSRRDHYVRLPAPSQALACGDAD